MAAPDAEPEAGMSCVQLLNEVELDDDNNNIVVIATATPLTQPERAIRTDICHACDSMELVPHKNK